MANLSAADYDLVYFVAGRRAHVKWWTARHTACGYDEPHFGWLGTGSQKEIDKADAMQLCKRCQTELESEQS